MHCYIWLHRVIARSVNGSSRGKCISALCLVDDFLLKIKRYKHIDDMRFCGARICSPSPSRAWRLCYDPIPSCYWICHNPLTLLSSQLELGLGSSNLCPSNLHSKHLSLHMSCMCALLFSDGGRRGIIFLCLFEAQILTIFPGHCHGVGHTWP